MIPTFTVCALVLPPEISIIAAQTPANFPVVMSYPSGAFRRAQAMPTTYCTQWTYAATESSRCAQGHSIPHRGIAFDRAPSGRSRQSRPRISLHRGSSRSALSPAPSAVHGASRYPSADPATRLAFAQPPIDPSNIRSRDMNPHVVAEGIPQLFNYDSPDRPHQEIIPVQQHQLPTQQTQSHSEIQARHFQHVLGSDDTP